MSDAWKEMERVVAKRLGGKRVGNSGRNTEDVSHDWLSIECKERQELPAWLVRAVTQAKANAPEGKLALVVLHGLCTCHDNDLVVLRLADFQAWFGDGE